MSIREPVFAAGEHAAIIFVLIWSIQSVAQSEVVPERADKHLENFEVTKLFQKL